MTVSDENSDDDNEEENTMTTKQQERKALEQIRKIVEGLGENSYIGTAFEGCFEIAEENIDCDFACSMKERKEAAEFAEDKLRSKVAEQEKQMKAMEEKIASMQLQLNGKDDEIMARSKDAVKMVEKINTLTESSTKYWNALQEAETKLDEKEDEIIRLKAKLYDLMTK